LSNYPYIKKGKNEVILTKEGFSRFIDFLKTGRNPTHKWEEKGNWTSSYSMYDIDILDQQIEKAMFNLIKGTFVLTPEGINRRILDVLEDIDSGVVYDENLMRMYDKKIKEIQILEWYNLSLSNATIKRFDVLSKKLKNKIL